MIELTYEQMERIGDFYENSTDSTIFSALQGFMGQAFVDSLEDLKHSFILQGDFLFPSCAKGEFCEEVAEQMLCEIGNYQNLANLLIIPQSDEWKDYFNKSLKYDVIKRYSLSKMKLSDFDEKKLWDYANQLPVKYRYERMDEALAKQALSMEWSKDFCSNFLSAEDYASRGLGIAILHGQELICAASSYTIYADGIEIEIATKESYRNQGLATMCGARLILECKKEQKIPNWDAANMMSVKIALKLGYQFIGEYNTYVTK